MNDLVLHKKRNSYIEFDKKVYQEPSIDELPQIKKRSSSYAQKGGLKGLKLNKNNLNVSPLFIKKRKLSKVLESELIVKNDLNKLISERMCSEDKFLKEENQSILRNNIKLLSSLVKLRGRGDKRSIHKLNNVFDSLSDPERVFIDNSDLVFIHPRMKGKIFWDYLIFYTILYASITTPYFICSFNSNGLMLNELFIELILLFDLISQFFTAVQTKKDNLIINQLIILQKYLKSSFLLDLLAVFPFEYFHLFNEDHTTNIFDIYSQFSIYLWFKLFRMLKLIRLNTISQFKFFLNFQYNRILRLFVVFIFVSHISTCFWIYLGKSNYYNTTNWIQNYNFSSQSPVELFVTSLYFNLVTMITIGYGDICSTNSLERIYNVFLLFFGVLFYTYMISNISSIFLSPDENTANYREKKKVFNDITEQYDLDQILINKIHHHFKNEAKNDNLDRVKFINSLPTNIKNQLTMKMYQSMVVEFDFFKDKSYDFILSVIPFFKKISFTKKERLFSIGELVNEVYFVLSGSLSLTLEESYENIEISMISKHHHFGDAMMVLNEVSCYDLSSKSRNTNLMILSKDDFFNIKNNFNHEIQKILKVSYNNLHKIEKRREEYIRLFESYNNFSRIKILIKKINIYLMQKGFDQYFYEGIDFQDENEFISNNDSISILNLMKSSFSHENRGMREITKMYDDIKKPQKLNNTPKTPYEKKRKTNKSITEKTPKHEKKKISQIGSSKSDILQKKKLDRNTPKKNKFKLKSFSQLISPKSNSDFFSIDLSQKLEKGEIQKASDLTGIMVKNMLSKYDNIDNKIQHKTVMFSPLRNQKSKSFLDLRMSQEKSIENKINININNNSYFDYSNKLENGKIVNLNFGEIENIYSNLTNDQKSFLMKLVSIDARKKHQIQTNVAEIQILKKAQIMLKNVKEMTFGISSEIDDNFNYQKLKKGSSHGVIQFKKIPYFSQDLSSNKKNSNSNKPSNLMDLNSNRNKIIILSSKDAIENSKRLFKVEKRRLNNIFSLLVKIKNND